jgi:hypothetical protein
MHSNFKADIPHCRAKNRQSEHHRYRSSSTAVLDGSASPALRQSEGARDYVVRSPHGLGAGTCISVRPVQAQRLIDIDDDDL